jgi:hypothetical protein
MPLKTPPGLYANIHAKRERIEAQKAAGKTPERMRKPKQAVAIAYATKRAAAAKPAKKK